MWKWSMNMKKMIKEVLNLILNQLEEDNNNNHNNNKNNNRMKQ